MDSPDLTYQEFYDELQRRFRTLLPKNFQARRPSYVVRSNRMHIKLDGITGSHYEICLRRDYHEIALHFQSSDQANIARRQAFDPLLGSLSQSLGCTVRSGKLENKGWMRVWIERPVQPVTGRMLDDYTDLFARFIAATFPTLEAIYR